MTVRKRHDHMPDHMPERYMYGVRQGGLEQEGCAQGAGCARAGGGGACAALHGSTHGQRTRRGRGDHGGRGRHRARGAHLLALWRVRSHQRHPFHSTSTSFSNKGRSHAPIVCRPHLLDCSERKSFLPSSA
eukprot:7384458-Prymnesium_polylepis.1